MIDAVDHAAERVGEPRRVAGHDDVVDEARLAGRRQLEDIQRIARPGVEHVPVAGWPTRDPQVVGRVDLHADERAPALDQERTVPGSQVTAPNALAAQRPAVERRAAADRDSLGREAIGQVDPVREGRRANRRGRGEGEQQRE